MGWRVVASQVTGRSHQRSNLPCQDRAVFRVTEGSILLVAVADGAGSASAAERGAEAATTAALDFLGEAIGAGRVDYESMLRDAARTARKAVEACASDLVTDVRQLASTLLLAVCGPNGGGALQIGDGVIVVGPKADGWCWVFWPQHGEYANTTRFLTDDDWESHLQAGPLRAADHRIAVITDGLERLALHYESKTVFQPFFDGLFRPLCETRSIAEAEALRPALEEFLGSDRVTSQTDDDISIVLAMFEPEECGG